MPVLAGAEVPTKGAQLAFEDDCSSQLDCSLIQCSSEQADAALLRGAPAGS